MFAAMIRSFRPFGLWKWSMSFRLGVFESELQETCKELSTLGGKVHGLAADVSNKEGREAAGNQTSMLTNQQKLII